MRTQAIVTRMKINDDVNDNDVDDNNDDDNADEEEE